jgi:uncharacterized protein (TIGR02453 family)
MPANRDEASVFAGFPPETLKFLKALGFHQTREWFEENRAIYLSAFKQPLEAYVEAASAACRAKKVPLFGNPRKATFRLNRDVRFSKNKQPYKTNGGAVLTRTGEKGSPGIFYTHISPGGGFFAAGFYHPEPEQLAAFRQALAKKPQKFLAMEKKLAAAKLEIVDREALKRNPRDYQDIDPRVEHAIRMKNFLTRRPYPDALLQDGPKLAAAAADFAKEAMPLLKWGWEIIG